jgi:hypothetical protein
MSVKSEHVCGVFCDPDTRTHSTRHDRRLAVTATVTFSRKIVFDNTQGRSNDQLLRDAKAMIRDSGIDPEACDVSIVYT